jgi:heme/copper-type cytochrome/quinol oxidase subunit 2
MILLARLCKIWINVSLLNILNIVTMFVPYTVATCREREGGKEEGISTAKQITAQINWTLKLILFLVWFLTFQLLKFGSYATSFFSWKWKHLCPMDTFFHFFLKIFCSKQLLCVRLRDNNKFECCNFWYREFRNNMSFNVQLICAGYWEENDGSENAAMMAVRMQRYWVMSKMDRARVWK